MNIKKIIRNETDIQLNSRKRIRKTKEKFHKSIKKNEFLLLFFIYFNHC